MLSRSSSLERLCEIIQYNRDDIAVRKADPILCHITKSAASNFRGVIFPLYFALLR